MSEVTRLMEYVKGLDAELGRKILYIAKLEKTNEFQSNLIVALKGDVKILDENLGHRDADCDAWEKIVETRGAQIKDYGDELRNSAGKGDFGAELVLAKWLLERGE